MGTNKDVLNTYEIINVPSFESIVDPSIDKLYKLPNGQIWSYSSNGIWTDLASGGNFAKIVYVDTANPNDATIFDLLSPPVTNDPTLASKFENLYIGIDGSINTWNGINYSVQSGGQSIGKSLFRTVRTSDLLIQGTTVDLTAYIGGGTQFIQNDSPISYDATNNVFKCDPTRSDYYDIRIQLRCNYTTANQQNAYNIILQRQDGSTIQKEPYLKLQGITTNTAEKISDFNTYCFAGGQDAFQLIGFRIGMVRIDGTNAFTINSLQTNFAV